MPLVVEIAGPVERGDRESAVDPLRGVEPLHAFRIEVVAVHRAREEQHARRALLQQVDRLSAVGHLVAQQAVVELHRPQRPVPSVEGVEPAREDRQQQFALREPGNRGDLVSERRREVGEASRAGVEAVDAAAVGADPDLVGTGIAVEREDRFVAQAVGCRRRRPDIHPHGRLADDEESAPHASGPDRAVRIAVEREDRISGQREDIARRVAEHLDRTLLGIEDVDAAAVGADPDAPLVLDHAEDDVVAQRRIAGVVAGDAAPRRVVAREAPVVGREPDPPLRIDQNGHVLLAAGEAGTPDLPAAGVDLQQSVPTVEAEQRAVRPGIDRLNRIGIFGLEAQQQFDAVGGVVVAEDLVLRSEQHPARHGPGTLHDEILARRPRPALRDEEVVARRAVAGQSAVGQHPDLGQTVLDDLHDVVAGQGMLVALAGPVAPGQEVVVTHQPLVRGADPDETALLGMNAPHARGHSVAGRDRTKGVLLPGSMEAAARTQAAKEQKQTDRMSRFHRWSGFVATSKL